MSLLEDPAHTLRSHMFHLNWISTITEKILFEALLNLCNKGVEGVEPGG